MARSTNGRCRRLATAGPMMLPPAPYVAAIVTVPIPLILVVAVGAHRLGFGQRVSAGGHESPDTIACLVRCFSRCGGVQAGHANAHLGRAGHRFDGQPVLSHYLQHFPVAEAPGLWLEHEAERVVAGTGRRKLPGRAHPERLEPAVLSGVEHLIEVFRRPPAREA